jgi:hypothetical protein
MECDHLHAVGTLCGCALSRDGRNDRLGNADAPQEQRGGLTGPRIALSHRYNNGRKIPWHFGVPPMAKKKRKSMLKAIEKAVSKAVSKVVGKKM